MVFEIEPHRGIGPVCLGMTRAEVTATMTALGGGPPRARFETTDCFFKNSFQVSFTSEGVANFIEVANDVDHVFEFEGHDVFDLPAAELVKLIQQFDNPDPQLSSPPSELLFPNLILTLWEPAEDYDRKGGHKRPVFGAFGIGAPTYLTLVREIAARRK